MIIVAAAVAAARTLANPDTIGLLSQKELPADYVAQLLRMPVAEHFQIGDQQDLLTRLTSATLRRLEKIW